MTAIDNGEAMTRRRHASSAGCGDDDRPTEGRVGVGAGGWLAFWDSEHAIYVNARHRNLHYRTIAAELRDLLPGPEAAVLDYGCGEALHANRLAAATRRLILCEAAPRVRAKLAERFAGHPGITVSDVEALAGLADGSLNLIALISVVQYLGGDELDRLLARFRRLLVPCGSLVVGDVIPPHVSPLTDAAALLRFGFAQGFLAAAVLGLVRTTLSDYRKLRTTLGLSYYSEPEMLQKLAAAGFTATRRAKNIGHNQARMTFVAHPA
jgi:SAM-dependent methyltransferase